MSGFFLYFFWRGFRSGALSKSLDDFGLLVEVNLFQLLNALFVFLAELRQLKPEFTLKLYLYPFGSCLLIRAT